MINYYEKIKQELLNNEISKLAKRNSINNSDLTTYYNVGKMLSEAGKSYGENIIGKYSVKLTQELGKKYNTTTLGFNIAPKINSFGRLPELVNPNHLVRYFLKDVDQKFAIQISQYAKKINSKR